MPICRDFCTQGAADLLLAMQKVVGSNPISRFRKTCICRSSSLRQSPCSSASGRTDSGPAADGSSAIPKKTPCLQAHSGSSEPKSFCGPAEGRVFRLVRPLASCSWKPARSCARTPARARPAIPIPRGESDFSPDTVGQPPLPRTTTPASHGSHRRDLTADGVRGSGAVSVTGGWTVVIARDSIAEAVAYLGSGHLPATERDSAHRPQQEPTESRREGRDHAKATGPCPTRSRSLVDAPIVRI